VHLSTDLPPMTSSQAISGVRAHFVRAFGRTWVGRRLGRTAWSTFRAALLHGLGLEAASELARLAAQERNSTTMLVARWSEARIQRVVQRAAQRAADAV
jgi:hypothetical protein